MKRLLFVLLLVSGVASAQTIDSVLATDTPNQGRVKINAAMQKVYGFPIDTTGLSAATRPMLVLQGDTMWVVKDGIAVGASQYRKVYMATDDSLGSYPENVFNVKVYGAVGDSVTNDSAAVRSAVTAAGVNGGVVFFPVGKYRIGTTLTITDTSITLLGESPSEYDPVANSFTIGSRIIGMVSVGGKNVNAKDLTFHNPSGGDVFVSSANDSYYDNCRFVGLYALTASHSFLTGDGQNVYISNCKSYKNVHGFAVRSSRVRMTNNYADSCGYNGLVIKSGDDERNHDIQVSGFYAKRSGSGIRVYTDPDCYLENVVLNNVQFDSLSGPGIYFENYTGNYEGMRSMVVSGGSARDVTSGIQFYQAANVSVSGFYVQRASGAGFGLDSSKNVLFTGCITDTVGNYGFYGYNSCQDIRVIGGFSRGSGGAQNAVGVTSYLSNGAAYLQEVTISDTSDMGINNAGITGNLKLISPTPRVQGVGPSIGFTFGDNTGTGGGNYTQAEIVGSPDNGVNSARGRLTLRTKDWDGVGAWVFKDAMTLHSNGDIDIGRAGEYDNWDETRLRIFGSLINPYLFKGFKSSDTTNAVIAIDSTGNVISKGDTLIGVTGTRSANTVPKYNATSGKWEVRNDSLHKGAASFIRKNADTWYSYPTVTASDPTTVALGANVLRAFPFFVATPYSVDSLLWEVTTGSSGAAIFGVYEDTDGDLYPDTLRFYGDSAYTTSTRVITNEGVAVNYTFKANTLYFVVYNTNATATVRGMGKAQVWSCLGFNPAMGATATYTSWSVNRNYDGTLPIKYNDGGGKVASASYPLLIWRVKP